MSANSTDNDNDNDNIIKNNHFVYRLTHSASDLSGFTCTSSLTMNEKIQYRTRLSI